MSAASISRSASSKLLAMLCTNGFATPYVLAHIDGSGERQTVPTRSSILLPTAAVTTNGFEQMEVVVY